jgi:hypothetical protein
VTDGVYLPAAFLMLLFGIAFVSFTEEEKKT